MDRRSFLKLVGISVVAPFAIAKASLSKPEGLPRDLLEKLLTATSFKAPAIKPVTIEGKEYYVMIMHPRYKYLLEVSIAKDKYKHESHVRRWEKRYGEKYPVCEAEEGSFGGVNWID